MSRRLLSYVSSYVVYQSPESSRRDSHQFHFCMSERACHRDYWSCIPTTAGSLSLLWRSVHVTTLTMPIVFRTWNPCYLRRYTASHLPVLCSLPSLVNEGSVPNPITIPVGSCLLQCPIASITLCQNEPQAFRKPGFCPPNTEANTLLHACKTPPASLSLCVSSGSAVGRFLIMKFLSIGNL